jgi:prepilin-type N-terminal cleavage/methylation domain-containing protein
MIFPMTSSRQHCHSRMTRGFTLPEMLIATAIFSMVIAGILVVNLFGLRMSQVVQAKANVTAWSRLTMERLQNEIHACNSAQLGTVSNGLFSGLLDGEVQQGSALLLYPSAGNTNYILYFVNSADQTLRRATEQPNSTVILANFVTTSEPFSAQDMAGNILTNNLNNRVIHVALEFYQPAYFTNDSDYYRFETSIKQRVLP